MNNAGGGGGWGWQLNSCPRRRLSYSFDMCIDHSEPMRAKCSIEFWIALPKKIDKVLATHKRLLALICNILG